MDWYWFFSIKMEKKNNIVSVYKKIASNLQKKYKKIFNKMFRFIIEYYLPFSNQSGFKLWCFCIDQILSITHKIHKCFNDGFEVRVFFFISQKHLIKFWHKGITFKLKPNSISGKLLGVLSDFLKDRKHRVT